VDFSKLKTPDWLMIGGGAAMLILGIGLDWTSVDTGFGRVSDDGPFDYFLTGGLAWLLVVAIGVLALLRALGKLPETQPSSLILLAMGVVATILMVLRVLLGARFDFADRGIGMYGALIWALVATAGAYLAHTQSGGTLKDLTDVDKLKSSFGGTKDADPADDAPPPPPPPPPAAPTSDTPPPPAPPA
jgi:hypothetical protein